MSSQTPYDSQFYASQSEGSRLSAKVVVPIILRLLNPKSAIDVGCGLGAWLSVFRELGVDTVLGIDGPHVDPSRLLIPKELFQPVDLSQPFTQGRKFDLAISLEVAEHLPPQSAEGFVRSLVNLAPVVVFSAAAPLQTGTYHINEQWPDYWHAKFARHNYLAVDIIRKEIWNDRRVKWWYRQNIFLYVSEAFLGGLPELLSASQASNDLLLVHPEILNRHLGLRASLKRLPRLIWKSIGRRLQ